MDDDRMVNFEEGPSIAGATLSRDGIREARRLTAAHQRSCNPTDRRHPQKQWRVMQHRQTAPLMVGDA